MKLKTLFEEVQPDIQAFADLFGLTVTPAGRDTYSDAPAFYLSEGPLARAGEGFATPTYYVFLPAASRNLFIQGAFNGTQDAQGFPTRWPLTRFAEAGMLSGGDTIKL